MLAITSYGRDSSRDHVGSTTMSTPFLVVSNAVAVSIVFVVAVMNGGCCFCGDGGGCGCGCTIEIDIDIC